MRRFFDGADAGEPLGAPPPGLYETRRPRARPTVESQVMVPLLQSIILALAGGVGLTWAANALGLIRGWWPLLPGLVLGVFLVAFLSRMFASEATLWSIETLLGGDINRDGFVGRPEEPHFVVVQGPGPEPPESRLKRELLEFVRSCYAFDDTSYARWEPLIGRNKYVQFRDTLIRSGLAAWRDPGNRKLGWTLTASPEDIERLIW